MTFMIVLEDRILEQFVERIAVAHWMRQFSSQIPLGRFFAGAWAGYGKANTRGW